MGDRRAHEHDVAQVRGLQVVLADGRLVDETNGLPKETAGPRLTDLVIGSEGTLAVVTAARLRLVPWYRNTAAALIACDSLRHAVEVLPQLRALPSLDAVEVLMPDALRVACQHLGITSGMTYIGWDTAAFTLGGVMAMRMLMWIDPSFKVR